MHPGVEKTLENYYYCLNRYAHTLLPKYRISFLKSLLKILLNLKFHFFSSPNHQKIHMINFNLMVVSVVAVGVGVCCE